MPFKYLNKTALDGSLTASTPASFPATIVDNPCGNFNGSTYVYVDYANNALSTAGATTEKVECYFSIPSSPTSYGCLYTNMFSVINGGINSVWVVGLTGGIKFVAGDYTKAFNTTFEADVVYKLTIECSTDNSVTVSINDAALAVTSSGSEATTSTGTIIGSRFITGLSNYFKGTLFDFRFYSDGTLTHHYPIAERDYTILYDAVGDKHAKIITTSISTFWTGNQSVYSYNSLNGYRCDSDLATAYVKAYIPLGRNLVWNKSAFLTSTDNWVGFEDVADRLNDYTVGISEGWLTCSRKGGDGAVFTDKTFRLYCKDNNFPIYGQGSYGRTFHLKVTIRNNTTTNDLSQVNFVCGWINGGMPTHGISSKYDLLSTPLAPGATIDIDTTLTIPSPYRGIQNTVSSIRFAFANNASAEEPISGSITNLELTQTNYQEDHPTIINGVVDPSCSLDFSQGISNIAEIAKFQNSSARSFPARFGINDANMGNYPSPWNIRAEGGNLYRNQWHSGTNVIWLVGSKTEDLPDGCLASLQIKTKSTLPNVNINGAFGYPCLTFSSYNLLVMNKCKAHIRLKYRKITTSVSTADNQGLSIGFYTTPWVKIKNSEITDNEWHQLDTWVTIARLAKASDTESKIGITWSDGTTTAEACGVIADFHCDIYPQEDTIAPLYAQVNSDGSFSNPALYGTPVGFTNLQRVRQHVDHP